MEMTCKQMPKVLGQYQQGYYSKVKILFKASLHLRPFRKTPHLVFDFNRVLSSKGSMSEGVSSWKKRISCSHAMGQKK